MASIPLKGSASDPAATDGEEVRGAHRARDRRLPQVHGERAGPERGPAPRVR